MSRTARLWARLASNRILKQFSTVLTGRLVGAVCQAVSILLLARWVDVESFGVCMALLGLLAALQTLGDVGASTFIAREVAAHGHNARVVAARRLSACATTTLAMVGVLACACLAVRGQELFALLLPLWGWLVLERITEVYVAIAMGQQRTFVVMANAAVRRGLSLALFCLLHVAGMAPLLAFSFGYLLGNTLALPLLLCCRRNDVASDARIPYRQVFSESRHYWVHSFALQARNVDAFLVGMISGSVQAAFYGLGARLLTPLRMVPSALASVMLSHSARHGRVALPGDTLAMLVLTFSIPYLALVFVWPLVIPWLFKAQYADAILPLQIMSAVLSISSCTSIVSAVLQGCGYGSRVSGISAFATTVTLTLVVLGSAVSGATGAAVGFAAGACVHMVLVTHAYFQAR